MTVLASDESEDEELTGPVDYHEPNEFTQEAVDPTFREDYEFPGTVKITVQDMAFWSVYIPLCLCKLFNSASVVLGHTRKCCTLHRHSSKRH